MRLLLIIGPPAVGKMTVGREIARRRGFSLMHNHHTIEPLVEIFGHGTPAFNVLNGEFRRRVIEEAARSKIDLIFSFVWDLDDPADLIEVQRLVSPYRAAGGWIGVIELAADLSTRLERNQGADRLEAKASKRDLEWSAADVRRNEAHRLNTDPTGRLPTAADPFLAGHPRLRLDTSHLNLEQTTGAALTWLDAHPATG